MTEQINQFGVMLAGAKCPIYVVAPCVSLMNFRSYVELNPVLKLAASDKHILIQLRHIVAAVGPNSPFFSLPDDPFPG